MNLLLGDCIEKMRELPENSVDAIITDPPYGLEFMGKDWDKFSKGENIGGGTTGLGTPFGRKQALPSFYQRTSSEMVNFQNWCCSWATEALRVLKEGGFMFAFGGTRTYHRLTCGIEDAGFQIRDCIAWTYASGFPKAQDLAMLAEKKLGGKGEETGKTNPNQRPNCTKDNTIYESGTVGKEVKIKTPTLPEAKRLIGWKTPALKPAYEPIVVAQKPIKRTIADNMLKNNVGGYNVDECRIPYENEGDKPSENELVDFRGNNYNPNLGNKQPRTPLEGKKDSPSEQGRFPPNLLSEDEVLDDGQITSQGATSKVGKIYGEDRGTSYLQRKEHGYNHADSGSFNRYFSLDAWWNKQLKTLPKEAQKTFPLLYCPKAGKKEKNKGLDGFEEKHAPHGAQHGTQHGTQHGAQHGAQH